MTSNEAEVAIKFQKAYHSFGKKVPVLVSTVRVLVMVPSTRNQPKKWVDGNLMSEDFFFSIFLWFNDFLEVLQPLWRTKLHFKKIIKYGKNIENASACMDAWIWRCTWTQLPRYYCIASFVFYISNSFRVLLVFFPFGSTLWGSLPYFKLEKILYYSNIRRLDFACPVK